MKKYTYQDYKNIAIDLYNKYYEYYCFVFIDFLIDAIENSIEKDGVNADDIDAIHQNIIENYI